MTHIYRSLKEAMEAALSQVRARDPKPRKVRSRSNRPSRALNPPTKSGVPRLAYGEAAALSPEERKARKRMLTIESNKRRAAMRKAEKLAFAKLSITLDLGLAIPLPTT
jgi:hypothetical protein